MVWIHGGGFTTGRTGAPMFDGADLANRGVIVVTVAYRLGAFGFLASPELTAESRIRSSGTYGIMDQVAALKWVRRNISAFGGDPAKVTIFGESAGAMSASILASSPKAKGLFRSVIAQSGAYFLHPTTPPGRPGSQLSLAQAQTQGTRFFKEIGARSLADARAQPADAVLRASLDGSFGFTPVPFDEFMVRDPFAAYADSRFRDTPIPVGFNSDEGSLLIPSIKAEQFNDMVRAQYCAEAPQILATYPGRTDAEALQSARRLMGDSMLVWPVLKWAELHSANGGKTYAYFFDHAVPHPDVPLFKGVSGAFHGADLAYVFGVPTPQWTPDDAAISKTFLDYWASFAKTGDPAGSGRPAWPAFTQQTPTFMRLGTVSQPTGIPFAERMRVFDALGRR